jgi:hypothetical protein
LQNVYANDKIAVMNQSPNKLPEHPEHDDFIGLPPPPNGYKPPIESNEGADPAKKTPPRVTDAGSTPKPDTLSTDHQKARGPW